jgi:hypothetical protein
MHLPVVKLFNSTPSVSIQNVHSTLINIYEEFELVSCEAYLADHFKRALKSLLTHFNSKICTYSLTFDDDNIFSPKHKLSSVISNLSFIPVFTPPLEISLKIKKLTFCYGCKVLCELLLNKIPLEFEYDAHSYSLHLHQQHVISLHRRFQNEGNVTKETVQGTNLIYELAALSCPNAPGLKWLQKCIVVNGSPSEQAIITNHCERNKFVRFDSKRDEINDFSPVLVNIKMSASNYSMRVGIFTMEQLTFRRRLLQGEICFANELLIGTIDVYNQEFTLQTISPISFEKIMTLFHLLNISKLENFGNSPLPVQQKLVEIPSRIQLLKTSILFNNDSTRIVFVNNWESNLYAKIQVGICKPLQFMVSLKITNSQLSNMVITRKNLTMEMKRSPKIFASTNEFVTNNSELKSFLEDWNVNNVQETAKKKEEEDAYPFIKLTRNVHHSEQWMFDFFSNELHFVIKKLKCEYTTN